MFADDTKERWDKFIDEMATEANLSKEEYSIGYSFHSHIREGYDGVRRRIDEVYLLAFDREVTSPGECADCSLRYIDKCLIIRLVPLRPKDSDSRDVDLYPLDHVWEQRILDYTDIPIPLVR